METVQDLITDKQVDIAWGEADFGTFYDKRDVIKYSLLKFACGYKTGKTAKSILEDLGLITQNENLTQRGKRYLYVSFKHSSQEQSN